jgi:predicted cupin superfamily sugar epimerase
MSPEQLIADLELIPLPEEGGMFSRHYRDEYSTAIYFLVREDDFSALHRLGGTEVYHFYGGAPLKMLLLHPSGRIERRILGTDIEGGQRPSIVIAAGVWQGAAPAGDWTLVGTTMAPGFEPEMFELGERQVLLDQYPAAREDIIRLTRVV